MSTPIPKRYFVLAAVLVVALIVTIALLHKTDTQPQTASDATKGLAASQINGSPKSSVTSNTPNKEEVSSFVLLSPTGVFVSNHHPNLSGHPAPSQIQSVCTSSVGADCTITFTKDGVVKSLPVQGTDSGGSTYWTWNLQDIGLTPGSWKIEAKASHGSQVKTAEDSLNLEVAE